MQSTVIYEKNGTLRLRDFSATEPTEIGAIDFYVALAAHTSTQVFLILHDLETGLHEVVELKESTNELGRPVFRVPLTYSLRLNKSHVTMQLMILDVVAQTHTLSDLSPTITMSTENYKLAREIAMVNELGSNAKSYYEAIIQALQEIVKKGENAE